MTGSLFAQLIGLIRAGVWCLAIVLGAPLAALDLEPGRGIPDLVPHLSYGSDPQADLARMLERFRQGDFDKDLSVGLLDTNYAPEAWAAVELFNNTVDDGRPADQFSAILDLPAASEVDIYLVREDGLTENLLQYSIFARFDPEKFSVTRLRSPEFGIAAQERVTLLIHFKFGPFQTFDLSLETPSEVQSSGIAVGVKLAIFYAFSFACLVFFVGMFLALRDWISLFYALLFAIGLALVAMVDGLLFRFFYPGQPQLQSAVGFFVIFALSGVGFLLAGHALAAGNARSWARPVRGLALISLAGFLAALVTPGPYVMALALGLLGAMVLAVVIAERAWRQKTSVARSAVFWLNIGLAVAIPTLIVLVITGWSRQVISPPDSMRMIYIVLLVATITEFAAKVILIRREHAQAVADKVKALEDEAERSKELLKAEQNYTKARELARARQRQLATASHDFRQPLASLRMTLDGLGKSADPELRSRLSEAFDYMESLSSDYLRDSTQTEDDDRDHPPAPEASDAPEPYPVSLIIQTVWQMFHEEAVSKGLRLRKVDCSVHTEVPPIVMMRIVSNLVSNAVKYTDEGSVLIGARRRKTGVEVWVCDTGPGMTARDLSAFQREGVKGAQSRGHGLGLAVCFGLAQEHGLTLNVTSEPDRGTCFSLFLGKADAR